MRISWDEVWHLARTELVVRVWRKSVVHVPSNPVMPFAALARGIDVDVNAAEVRHVVEELVLHFARHRMPLSDGEMTGNGDAQIGG